MSVFDFLADLGLNPVRAGSQLRVNCPNCDDTKRHLYVAPGNGGGHCHKCGFSHNPYQLTEKVTSKSPAEIMALLERFGLNDSDKVSSTSPKPEPPTRKPLALSRDEVRELTDEEKQAFCKLKQIDVRAFDKFRPYAHTSKPWVLLPAFSPEDNSRACGWLRCGIDGQDIRLADGRMEKYPAIARSRHGLFGLPWLMRENSDTVIFCEAWRDALAAISLDLYATASSGGASCFNNDWLPFFEGRTVYIVMDCDVAGQRAAERTAAAIVRVAKEVCMVQLPYEITESHGKDLHDFVTEKGRDFLLLLSKAKKYVGDEVVECGDDVLILEDDHHDTIAAAFEEWSDVRHRHHIETWTVVESEKYRIVQEGEIKKWIRRFGRVCRLKKRKRIDGEMKVFIDPLKVTSHLVNGVLDALSALDGVWIQPEFVPPVFLSGGGDVEHIIAMDNCLLNIAGVEPQEMPLTEDFYTLNYLPFAYDSGAKCPAWLKFLGEVFGKEGLSSTETRWDDEKSDFVEVSECMPDEQAISILQEFMGLLRLCGSSAKRIRSTG